ncbi:MAG: hypothetical protein L6R41_007948 [Letrouitia leprolyta]|nr:MAG: hypothetical protein L6R41_007948 [Letrouitia leprolyta]
MSEKRKPTTRYQGERPPKRRQLSPPPPPPPAPKKLARKEPANLTKEEISGRSKETLGLPIQAEKQGTALSDEHYQTVAERSVDLSADSGSDTDYISGILAASIQQSRQKWAAEGIFDRYWARPSRKKGQAEPPNPAKETMAKIGTCSIIIEPHVFEATLYSVKEVQSVFVPSQLPPPPPPPPPNPAYNPYQDHNTYQTQAHTSYNHGTLPQYHQQYQPASSNLTLPPFREGFGQFSSQGPPSYHKPIAPSREIHPTGPRENIPPPNAGPATTTAESEKPTDPVIQMLATRAASDHNLKALMKVVASGHATQEQLREFQDHIDELNSLIKSRESVIQSRSENHPRPPPPPSPVQTGPPAPSPSPLHQQPAPASSIPYTPQPQTPRPVKIEAQPQTHQFPHVAQPPKSKATMSVPYRPENFSIVFDLCLNGDRFTFPRNSILEYLPGGTQVIASFLVIRKGSAAATLGEYNKTTTYYQPVTIRLSSSNPKYLEPLARAVAAPEEVRKYMNGVFDKMSPAKSAFLMTRLPKAKGDEDVDMKDAPSPQGVPLVKKTYPPPNSLVPLAA